MACGLERPCGGLAVVDRQLLVDSLHNGVAIVLYRCVGAGHTLRADLRPDLASNESTSRREASERRHRRPWRKGVAAA